MITAKKLICPHNKELEQQVILGLTIYFHKDDLDANNEPKACMLYNRLDVKQDTLSYTQYSRNPIIEPSKEFVSLYATSKSVRNDIYKALSILEPNHLVEMLHTISKIMDEIAFEQDDYYLEMIQIFGQVCVLNIKIALGLDFSQKADLTRQATLPMKKIKLEHVKDRIITQPSKLKQLEDIVDASSIKNR